MLSEENLDEVVSKVTYWIYEYVRNSGAKGVVVGNSGGKDSAVVIALSVKALGNQNVITVGLPCESSPSDLEYAKLVADTFDVPLLEIELSGTYSVLERKISQELRKHGMSEHISKEAGINMKPRLRMTSLYSIAQTMGYLVIGTSNLSEIMVGYTTKWGDAFCDFNPIANFTAEEVKLIGKYLGVPEIIIERPPDDGLSSQTDEEKMGVTYANISEYINTGNTDNDAMEKIERMNKASIHKRETIPGYDFERNNYLKKL